MKLYDADNSGLPSAEVKKYFEKENKTQMFQELLTKFPPVFHKWFLESFIEPTDWFANRLAYSSTTAVMSMVGYIVGFISLTLVLAIDMERTFCLIVKEVTVFMLI